MGPDDRKKPDNTPKPDGEWTKEHPGRERPFDFDAFLEDPDLEEQVTGATDGEDAPEGGDGGQYPARGRSGRHEAPEPGPAGEPGPDYPGDLPTQRFTNDGPPTQRFSREDGMPPRQGQQPRPQQQPWQGQQPRSPQQQPWQGQPPRSPQQQPWQGQQPRSPQPPPRQGQPPRPQQQPRPQRPINDPPPRPKVIVAEPAPRVVVTPERQYPEAAPPRKGMGKGVKFLIAMLLSLAVLLAVAVLAVTLLPGSGSSGGGSPSGPAPSPTDYLFGGLPTRAPAAPTDVPPATDPPATPTPVPTPPPISYYAVSVTAGTGGSVSPNGMVNVEEGGSLSFTITPDWGYELVQLIIDGSNVSVTNTYTFSDIRQNHTLYAIFQQIPPTQPPATDVPAPTDVPVVPEIPVTPEEQVMPEAPPAVEG